MADRFTRTAGSTLMTALVVMSPGLKDRFDAVKEWREGLPPMLDEALNEDLRRQVTAVVSRSASHIRAITEEQSNRVSANDLEVTIDIIDSVLNSATAIFSRSEVIEYSLTPTMALQRLQPAAESQWKASGCSQAAISYGRQILASCCYQLVSWLRQLPGVGDEAAWTNLIKTSRLETMTEEMLSELDFIRRQMEGAEASLARSQRLDLAATLGRMELFGLPVTDPAFRLIPIDISYVTTRAVNATLAHLDSVPFNTMISHMFESQLGLRLLVVGKAGSGKTTAVQWLAYQVALNRVRRIHSKLSNSMPFFVRLRNVHDLENSIPSDDVLVASLAARANLAREWLERLAETNLPLLILDGWDEIKPKRRTFASAWIRRLEQRIPGIHIIVTSRPEATRDEILAQSNFETITLTPLQPVDARTLVHRWFSGVRRNLDAAPHFDMHRLEDSERQVLADMRGPVLSELTDTPLMTSMLSYLYATNAARNPPSRPALYEMVTAALTHARDLFKGVSSGVWDDDLSQHQKESLLERIAYEMTKADRLHISQHLLTGSDDSSMESYVRRLLPAFDLAESTSYAVVEAILDRSVVMHRVGAGDAEFIHKSLQEFYTGQYIRKNLDIEETRSLFAVEGNWSLLPYAIYGARKEAADAIVNWILSNVETSTSRRRRGNLLVLLECLSSATELSPQTRAMAKTAVEEIFPPRSVEEASAVASVGDAAIAALVPQSVPRELWQFAIEALARIGTPSSLGILGQYAAVADHRSRRWLVQGWDRLNDEAYVNLVLARVPSDLELQIRSRDRLEMGLGLPNIGSLTLRGVELEIRTFSKLSHMPKLKYLNLKSCTVESNLAIFDEIQRLDSLRSLEIGGSSEIELIGSLGRQLWNLHLGHLQSSQIDWESMLGGATELRSLAVDSVAWRSTEVRPIGSSTLQRFSKLQTLALGSGSGSDDFEWSASVPGLKRLSSDARLSSSSVQHLARFPKLHDVSIRISPDVSSLASVGGLLTFEGCAWTVLSSRFSGHWDSSRHSKS